MSTLRFSVLAAIITMAFLSNSERVRAADDTATVEGTVLFDGKPLAGARIFFHFGDGQFVGAKVGKDGKYKMKAVPTGTYKVTVEMWHELKDGSVVQVVPEKYSAEDKSELQVKVKPGANTLDFKLASK
jgi:hypothetical protein